MQGTAKIKLINGGFALIDKEDFERVSLTKWQLTYKGYVAGYDRKRGQYRIYLHRLILKPKRHELIDHKNRNPLDNRKCNLRVCDQTMNHGNSVYSNNRTSKYKGVHFEKFTLRWKSKITFRGKQIHLGRFNSQKEAAKAYNLAAKKYFGEFALLNKV